MSLPVGSSSATTYPYGYFGPRTLNRAQLGDAASLANNPVGQSPLLANVLSQYAQTSLAGVGQAVNNLVVNANRLTAATQPFLSTDSLALLNARTASTSSPAIQATVQPGATIQNLQVAVQSLATAQQDIGTTLNAASTNTVQTGANTFQLTVGGRQTTLTVQVGKTDTNNTVLSNMAGAINAAALGVTAQVQANAQGGAQLLLTSNQTGAANTFSLQDVSGNLVATTGGNTVVGTASDAQINVNGIRYTSGNNKLSLDNGKLALVFTAITTPSTVTVSAGAAAHQIANAVQTLVNATNQYQLNYQTNKAYLDRMADLAPILKGVDLATLGLTQNSDHTLSLNQPTLINSLQSNFARANNALVGLWGLASTLNNQAQFVLDQPSSSLAAFNPPSSTSLVANANQQILANSLVGLFLNVRL